MQQFRVWVNFDINIEGVIVLRTLASAVLLTVSAHAVADPASPKDPEKFEASVEKVIGKKLDDP